MEMEEQLCVACGEDATEGYAIGRLCYYCIERAVVHIVKKEQEQEKDAKK